MARGLNGESDRMGVANSGNQPASPYVVPPTRLHSESSCKSSHLWVRETINVVETEWMEGGTNQVVMQVLNKNPILYCLTCEDNILS